VPLSFHCTNAVVRRGSHCTFSPLKASFPFHQCRRETGTVSPEGGCSITFHFTNIVAKPKPRHPMKLSISPISSRNKKGAGGGSKVTCFPFHPCRRETPTHGSRKPKISIFPFHQCRRETNNR
jgi:hypothetical protein